MPPTDPGAKMLIAMGYARFVSDTPIEELTMRDNKADATLTMRWVEAGILMPDWIEEFHAYLAVIDGKPQFMDFDGDNGIHAFDGDDLKEPYETRMRFLAIQIEVNHKQDTDDAYIQEYCLGEYLFDCGLGEALEGFENWFLEIAPHDTAVISHQINFAWDGGYINWEYSEYESYISDILLVEGS
jgi:hypothetical protein